ncbi:MAG: hypothetical protein ACREAX_03115 [Candidatus Nitrosotenuis sp.]
MSGTEPQDIFSLYKKNINEFFAGVEKFLPNYHQSVTNLQQEWLQTCENTTKSMISVQQEFASKAGINTTLPEAMLETIKSASDDVLKIYSAQAQTALAAIDVTRQNIKTFNDNAGFFADISKNIAQYWTSLFAQKRN